MKAAAKNDWWLFFLYQQHVKAQGKEKSVFKLINILKQP